MSMLLLVVLILTGCLPYAELLLSSGAEENCRKNITEISPSLSLLEDIPSDATLIQFCENNITNIDKHSFKKFTELERLNLDKNPHLKFPSDGTTFIQQETLIDFQCFQCGLEKIFNQSLVGMPRLEHLYLTENKIDQIESNAFQQNRNLRVIILRSNLLKRVPREMLLNVNEIQTVDLSHNEKLATEDDQPFLNSDALQVLLCDGCGFEIVHEKTFSGLLNLSHLYLRKNRIAEVHARAFFHMSLRPKLKQNLLVSLEFNQLQRIDSEVKIGLQLCLYGNKDLECFLRTLSDKDSFVCPNSTQPEIECIPPTTTTGGPTTGKFNTLSSSPFADTTNKAGSNKSRQIINASITKHQPSNAVKPNELPVQILAIFEAHISGYLRLLSAAQIVALVLLFVVWLKLKKLNLEIDRYAERIDLCRRSPNSLIQRILTKRDVHSNNSSFNVHYTIPSNVRID
ncbi:reticulon-4 receptor-like [Armigeres subalbatus]|uniref:reticulon-4 receptor-like n=1 Tax=Armigeres subalbatus TaxID=124917 RepID=UPI002ECFBBAD